MKIKICGLKRPEDIAYVNEAAPDFAGFVFAGQKRKVTPEQATGLRQRLAPGILPVGVFVNAPPEQIVSLCAEGTIEAIQLHGQEDAEYIRTLRQLLQEAMPRPVSQRAASEIGSRDRVLACGMGGIPLIRAVRVESVEDIRRAEQLDVEYLLLDHGAGGTGESFDWTLLQEAGRLRKPFFLAGGMRAENVREAVQQIPYPPFAIDMSSSVEDKQGRKDREKILRAVSAVRRLKE